MTQKEQITEISNKTGISKTWIAGTLLLSRSAFNMRMNRGTLTDAEIELIKKKTGYDNSDNRQE